MQAHKQTTMKAAFVDAGYVPPDERLAAVCTAALRANPRNFDGAKDALFKAAREDAELMWEMFAPYRAQAAQAALQRAATEIRDSASVRASVVESSARGQILDDNPASRAPRANTSSDGGGQHGVASQSLNAPVVRSQQPSKHLAAQIAERARVVSLTLLDTVIINGRPVGKLTAREAGEWATKHKSKARFVELLVSGLPPDAVIERFRTGDEALAIQAQVAQEIGGG